MLRVARLVRRGVCTLHKPELQRSPAEAVIEAVHSRFGAHFSQREDAPLELPPLPSPEEVQRAVGSVAAEKNGYLAWSLYAALRQGGVHMKQRDAATLAGTMLHVDHDLFADTAANRTFSVLQSVRDAGEEPRAELLEHAAAACDLIGLPDQAAELLDEHTRLHGRRSSRIVSSLIEVRAATARDLRVGCALDSPTLLPSAVQACGRAQQLPRAIKLYRKLERDRRRRPPGTHEAVALLRASEAAGDLDHAFALFHELMDEPSFPVFPGVFAPLLRGCAAPP